jgi:hypothetical protein
MKLAIARDHGSVHDCDLRGPSRIPTIFNPPPIVGFARPRLGVEVTPVSSEIVRYQVDDETVAKFEIEPTPGFHPAGPRDIAGKVWDAAGPSVEAAMAVMERVKRMSPDAVEISFGVKVTGTMDWIVAKAATEGNFQITLSWQPDVSRGGAAGGA